VVQTWPIIGRGKEIASILADLRRGVGTVVVGEAGVGKTMLAREVRRRLDADGWRTDLVMCSARPGFSLPTLAQAVAVEGPQGLLAVGRRPRLPRSPKATVLLVDDAHLLDEESAELLWRMAGGGVVLVVATVRLGTRAPDRVARLWADGACSHLALAPLVEGDVRALLELVLGGDVEDRLPRLLVRRAAGNALLLRELVRSGVDSGAIVHSHEVWRLAGELPVGAGAADLIRGNLAGLDRNELRAVQLLAIGEPLRLEVAESIIGHGLMEALEDKRILALVDTMDGPVLTLGHPLYGEVLRADIAPLRLRRLQRELIKAVTLAEAPIAHDVLRSVLWRVELGDVPDPADLLAAARLARSFSHAMAERLARAALAKSRSVDAVVLLAEILVMQGRVAEADRLFDELAPDSLSDEERQTVTYGRALCQTRLGEVSEVAAMITGAAVDKSANSLQVQAIYAQALMLNGRIDEAMVTARPLFDDESADPVTRTIAACSLIVGESVVGRASDSHRVMRESLSLAEAARAVLPFGLGTVMVAATIGLSHAGRVDEADQIGHQMYDRALAEDDEWLRPRGASGLGVTALMRGQARTATRYFRIAVASLNELDGQYLCYNLSFLARGAALAGFLDEARSALQAPSEAPRFPFFEAEWAIAEAALLAAEGTFEEAAEQALVAARQAASLGEWTIVGLAAHDAARYTATPEAAALAVIAAERVDGPLHPNLADYATARVADDPRLLTIVSERFEALGTILFAAEAAYAAARACRTGGDGRAAATATVRATALHARCENASIPWVAGFQADEMLTRREQQIALLAAAGSRDSAIAVELAISVRTVQNHLARVYRKLGVARRHDLPGALALTTEDRSGPRHARTHPPQNPHPGMS
jgi:DNA-binding CsgD family transcriptional regulator